MPSGRQIAEPAAISKSLYFVATALVAVFFLSFACGGDTDPAPNGGEPDDTRLPPITPGSTIRIDVPTPLPTIIIGTPTFSRCCRNSTTVKTQTSLIPDDGQSHEATVSCDNDEYLTGGGFSQGTETIPVSVGATSAPFPIEGTATISVTGTETTTPFLIEGPAASSALGVNIVIRGTASVAVTGTATSGAFVIEAPATVSVSGTATSAPFAFDGTASVSVSGVTESAPFVIDGTTTVAVTGTTTSAPFLILGNQPESIGPGLGNSWTVRAVNVTGEDQEITVFAVCATFPR